jgi:hypothetical protein
MSTYHFHNFYDRLVTLDNPSQSEKFHQERRKFLFLTARKDYHFDDENLPRQKPNIKYPISFQSNLFYMTA